MAKMPLVGPVTEVDKDGNVIKARRTALNDGEEIEKNVLEGD